MGFLKVVAEKRSDSVLMDLSLTTESRLKDPDVSSVEEEYREIYRVVVQQDAFNVTDVDLKTDILDVEESLEVRFNQDTIVSIYPLSAFQPFQLVNQQYSPLEVKGSRFFRGTLEYVSVGQWRDLEWDTQA
jgi:hypothetical protein